MEHDKSENECLELVVLVFLSLLVVVFVEFADSATQVCLQILGSLIGNLDGVLKDRLWNDFHVW